MSGDYEAKVRAYLIHHCGAQDPIKASIDLEQGGALSDVTEESAWLVADWTERATGERKSQTLFDGFGTIVQELIRS